MTHFHMRRTSGEHLVEEAVVDLKKKKKRKITLSRMLLVNDASKKLPSSLIANVNKLVHDRASWHTTKQPRHIAPGLKLHASNLPGLKIACMT